VYERQPTGEIKSLKMFIGISFVSAFIELESTRFSDVFIREGNDDYESGQRGGNNLHADARQGRTAEQKVCFFLQCENFHSSQIQK